MQESRLNQVSDWDFRARASKYDTQKLAKSVNVSVRHLERFFRSRMGMPPRRWLHIKRIQSASELLDGTRTVKEIGARTGLRAGITIFT